MATKKPSIPSWKLVDITTTSLKDNDKAFIVDKQLLDIVFGNWTKASLDQVKDDVKSVIDHAVSVDDMFEKLESHMYLHKAASNYITVVDELENKPGPFATED